MTMSRNIFLVLILSVCFFAVACENNEDKSDSHKITGVSASVVGTDGDAYCIEVDEPQKGILSCPGGQVITSIDFASYGTPTGLCSEGFSTSTCHASTSKSEVQSACLDKQSCTVSAHNTAFGDPCPGTHKRLAVIYKCSGSASGSDACPSGLCGCGMPNGTCPLKGQLEECKQRLKAALPSIQGTQTQKFMQAHREESPNSDSLDAPPLEGALPGSCEQDKTGHFESGYFDTEKAAVTLALAKPILERSDLDNFISDPPGDLDMVRCAVLAYAIPAGLEEFIGQGQEERRLVEDLLSDHDLMEQMLFAGGPKAGRYGPAMEIYKDIRNASRRAGRAGLFQRLALATSLELAARDLMPDYKDIEPVKRYLYYEKSYLDGELIPQFEAMAVWDYRHVINDWYSEDDLTWMREMLRNFLPEYILHTSDEKRFIGIQDEDNVIPQIPVSYDASQPESWHQQVFAKGGQCGAKSFVMRTLMRSFGVPTWGMQTRSHSGISHWTPSGWTPNLQVKWKQSYYLSDVVPMNAMLHILEAKARAVPDEFIKALRLEWIGDVLGEEDTCLMHAGHGGLYSALALNKKRAIAGDEYWGKPDGISLHKTKKPDATQSDKQIIVDQSGVITIPAVACVNSENEEYSCKKAKTEEGRYWPSKKIKFIQNEQGEMLLHYKRWYEIQSFDYIVDVPQGGTYTITADVVTINMDQLFWLTVNNAGVPKRFEMPYTKGMWETSKGLNITLKEGKNVLSFTRKLPSADYPPLWCARNSDPACGATTIKSFTLTPI